MKLENLKYELVKGTREIEMVNLKVSDLSSEDSLIIERACKRFFSGVERYPPRFLDRRTLDGFEDVKEIKYRGYKRDLMGIMDFNNFWQGTLEECRVKVPDEYAKKDIKWEDRAIKWVSIYTEVQENMEAKLIKEILKTFKPESTQGFDQIYKELLEL